LAILWDFDVAAGHKADFYRGKVGYGRESERYECKLQASDSEKITAGWESATADSKKVVAEWESDRAYSKSEPAKWESERSDS